MILLHTLWYVYDPSYRRVLLFSIVAYYHVKSVEIRSTSISQNFKEHIKTFNLACKVMFDQTILLVTVSI